jgi:4-methylaminobutanoate oxidase (formaldehyde-forming)
VRASDGAVVTADWVNAGSYEVNVGGQLYPVSVSLKPLYDPDNMRIRPRST